MYIDCERSEEKILKTKTTITTQRLALLALLTAACTVGRISFAVIPNIQPMTAILLLLAFFTTLKEALLVTLLSLLTTNLYLGMGPWTISQFVAFTGVVLLFHILGKVPLVKKHLTIQAVFAFLTGLLYGVIVSFMEVSIYRMPSFLAYYIQGVTFDLFHSVGNFGFYLIFYPIFQKYFVPKLGIKKAVEN